LAYFLLLFLNHFKRFEEKEEVKQMIANERVSKSTEETKGEKKQPFCQIMYKQEKSKSDKSTFGTGGDHLHVLRIG
jgi:hypothetical protein